jgi:hypothetical protein
VPERQDVLNFNPSLFTPFVDDDLVRQQPISIGVWEALPCHYPPTCRLDQIFYDLVADRKPMDLIGANEYEFHNAKFPSIAALLNPRHYAATYPLATTIAAVCF